MGIGAEAPFSVAANRRRLAAAGAGGAPGGDGGSLRAGAIGATRGWEKVGKSGKKWEKLVVF